MSMQNPTDDRPRADRPVELTPTEARQGFLGRPVLAVLVIGLVLAMLAWAAVEFWGMSIAPRETTTDPATTSSTVNDADKATETPPAGDKRQTEPVLIDPNATGNQ
jgi:hypothetical protein